MPQQTQYTHDIFISYSHRDREWVQSELLPQLEAVGLKIIVDYRDFEIGTPSLRNMERAVDTCRYTLVVLTPAWIASEWTEFENLLAASKDPTGRQRKILPLLLERCDCLPRSLSILTYADLTNPAERTREIERLMRSITPHSASDPLPVLTINDPASVRPVTPVKRRQELRAAERIELAELLRRSGRAESSARKALCIEIEIEPDTLGFLTATSPHDFAIELVTYLHQTGKITEMLQLCNAIAPMLGGPYAASLAGIRDQLR